MLGLRRDTVQLVAHHADWTSAFQAEAAVLQRHAGNLVIDIQHVGSTAVADMPAKPILDLALAVSSRHLITDVVARLAAAGYVDRGDAGPAGGHLVVRDSEPGIRVVHIHIVETSDPQWREYLDFRDVLRRDSLVRRRYPELKRSLAEQFSNDRTAYTSGKNAFIRAVLGREPL